MGEKLFWIDFCCVNQRGIAPGVACLPLYAANCASMSILDHVEYDERAWTRAERVIFASFNKPEFVVIMPVDGFGLPSLLGGGYSQADNVTQMGVKELKEVIRAHHGDTTKYIEKSELIAAVCQLRRQQPRPAGGDAVITTLEEPSVAAGAKLTNSEAYSPLLQRLVSLARRRWSQGWRGLDQKYWCGTRGLRHLHTLDFGATEVVLRMDG